MTARRNDWNSCSALKQALQRVKQSWVGDTLRHQGLQLLSRLGRNAPGSAKSYISKRKDDWRIRLPSVSRRSIGHRA